MAYSLATKTVVDVRIAIIDFRDTIDRFLLLAVTVNDLKQRCLRDHEI